MKLVPERGPMQWPVSILPCSQCSSHALRATHIIRQERSQKVALFIFNASVELRLREQNSKLRTKSDKL